MFELSFSEEFFSGEGEVDIYDIAPSDRPTSVLQAIISLPMETQVEIAREVMGAAAPYLYVGCDSFPFDVLDVVRKTDLCANLDSPVRVYIDSDQNYHLDVYE